MKVFIAKSLCLVLITYLVIAGVNYRVDPAYIYHTGIVDMAAEKLSAGNIIYSPGDFDEGLFNEKMVQSLNKSPYVVIIGSSHVMYVPWEYDNYFVAGLSGAYVGDYYALIGLFEDKEMMPKKVVFGIDPWAYMTSYNNGRHSSIKKYALAEYDRINDKETKGVVSDEPDCSKFKELVSFPYFQSSIRTVRTKGISYYLHESGGTVKIADNDSVEAEAKILPNCRRIMENGIFGTVEQNMTSAEQVINVGSIYQLGSELKDVNPDNFRDFEMLVTHLLDEGVDVEFYLPSWFPMIYDFFRESPNFAGVLEVENEVRALGEHLGITVHGSYDPNLCGVNATDFADWLHLKAEKSIKNFNFVLN